MVTKKSSRRLYLKENREAKKVSADEMAKRLGIERESVYRLEKRYKGVSSEKQASYAAAIGLEPEDLWRLPGTPPLGTPSIDAMLASASKQDWDRAADIVKRLIEK